MKGKLPTPVSRVTTPEHRVTIRNIVEWQEIRGQHDQFAKDPTHNLVHVVKALGPIAAALEHRHHGEPEIIEEKRYADLIIHVIWLVNAMGFDPAALAANRFWDIGNAPKRTELPPEERDVSSVRGPAGNGFRKNRKRVR